MTTFQPEKLIKPSHKRGCPTLEGTSKDFKPAKQSDHWLNPTPTSNRYTALQQKEELDNQLPIGKETIPTPSPNLHYQCHQHISPLILLLDQLVSQHYEIKALAHNQVKVQPKTSDSYRIITKALMERHTQFHTYKLKEERTYRVVLKTCTTLLIQKKSKTK
jgi:hypothetical protein